MIEEIKTLEEEVKQLKLERDTAVFVARERLDNIERIQNQKEIFELRYLKEEKENDKLHSIIKEVREKLEYLLTHDKVEINGRIYIKQEADDFITNYILEILDKGSDKE